MQNKSTVSWKCPSNIALVKYWGKYGRQLPSNPSISFTLNNAHTITKISYEYFDDPKKSIELDFRFEGKPNKSFSDKLSNFLNSIKEDYSFLKHLDLQIESENSFPHSSGIASSASSMAALAMCLLDIESQITGSNNIDITKASCLARLASGSACRSVYPQIAVWGETTDIEGSSNLHAIPFQKHIHPLFLSFHDDILIVSKNEKSVSSRAGHALMKNNPYSKARFEQAFLHLKQITAAMNIGDIDTFGHIVEKEALTLHALMMSSDPPYILIEPNTLKMINAIQCFRTEEKIPVYFTLDAGPNIHLLYPDDVSNQVSQLKDYLRGLCVDDTIINDQVGQGPVKISN